MDGWGSLLLGALEGLAEMAALGFDLPADSFTSRMKYGPHLLAPTGTCSLSFVISRVIRQLLLGLSGLLGLLDVNFSLEV